MSGRHSPQTTRARAELLGALKGRRYAFVTPTPTTHARVVARPQKRIARDLRDVFGWSLPFREDSIDAEILDLMREGDVLDRRGDLLVSRVRASTLGGDYFLHSAFPTTQKDAVFLGPDSYRFAAFVREELPRLPSARRLVDVGAGAGVGGIAALRSGRVETLTATDVNPAATALLEANFDFVRQSAQEPETFSLHVVECNSLDGVEGRIDCVIANPPYMADAAHRVYCDGGGGLGSDLSLAWARDAAARLEPGGAFLLYTGSAIVDGEDRLKAGLSDALNSFAIDYRELDPDVFGEELERAAYADVERIAAVGVVAVKD